MPSPIFRGARAASVVCDVGGVATMIAARPSGLPASFVKRSLTAVVGIPIFVWIVMGAPRFVLTALIVALSGIAAWELMRMFEQAGRPGYTRLGVVGAAAVTASFAAAPGVTPIVFTLAVVAVLSAPIWLDVAPAVEPAAATLLAVVYVGWLLGHALVLGMLADGAGLLLFLVGITWAGESAAYVVGSTMGKRPLAGVISPRKTVEGAAGQLVASVVAAALLGAWLLPAWSTTAALVAGAMLGVTGQVGDLVESVMKRSLGAKDTGGLIPGHGGALDRLDGLLFNAPALFYYASWVGGRG